MHTPASICEAIKFLAPSADAAKGMRYRALMEFVATSEDVRRAFRTQLGREGITLEGFQALAAIRSFSPDACSPSVIASKVATTRALLSHTLTRLEYSRLITRERDKDDRRVIWLRLTEEGERLVAKAISTCSESVLQLVEGFEDQDLKGLIATCEKLQQRAMQLS